MKKTICTFIILISHCGISAQNLFKNTLKFDDRSASPSASLSDIDWIQGHWRGEAFGGVTEEVWTPPHGNSMMCAFKLIVKNEVQFYELVTISEENGTLIMRLKHFDGKMIGWEAKDESIDFKLVKISEDKVYFDEFTFERISDDEMTIYVVIENKDKREEVPFLYTRFKE
jgi:hypothetical protein